MEKLYSLAIFSILVLFSFFFIKEKLFHFSRNLKKSSIYLENIFYFDKDLKLAILKIKNEKYYILFNQSVISIIKTEKESIGSTNMERNTQCQ